MRNLSFLICLFCSQFLVAESGAYEQMAQSFIQCGNEATIKVESQGEGFWEARCIDNKTKKADGEVAIFSEGKPPVLMEKGHLVMGSKEGLWQYWHRGKKNKETQFKNNLKDGNEFTYWGNGKIKLKLEYESDRHLATTSYREDGTIETELKKSINGKEGYARDYDKRGKMTKDWVCKGDVCFPKAK